MGVAGGAEQDALAGNEGDAGLPGHLLTVDEGHFFPWCFLLRPGLGRRPRIADEVAISDFAVCSLEGVNGGPNDSQDIEGSAA